MGAAPGREVGGAAPVACGAKLPAWRIRDATVRIGRPYADLSLPASPFDFERRRGSTTNAKSDPLNVLLLVPDGVSARNFLLGALPDRLAESGPVDVLLGAGLDRRPETQIPALRHRQELWRYPERLLEAPVRRTLEYSHQRWCDTAGTRFMLSAPIPGSGRSRLLRRAARGASRLTASERMLRRLVQAHDALADHRPEVDVYVDLLREWRTAVVLCAHQRPITIQPVVMAARRLGIPTATFIFSWDNLTTKGRVAAPFDHFFVWSDQMETELVRYYPDVSNDRIHVVGSPQFEPYADPSLVWTRDRFDQELGLEPGRPVICFSGGDTLGCPEDPAHLRIVCELVRDGELTGDPQIVLRPAPVDTSDRFDNVLQDFPIVLSRPRWEDGGRGWDAVTPRRDDIELLVNLTRYSDLNINMASTMTLDFAIHDTPVVNLGFDVDPTIQRASRYYDFDHYRPVVDLGAARVAKDPAALAEAINTYLADPALDRDGRSQFVDLELSVRPGGSVPAIAEALSEIESRSLV